MPLHCSAVLMHCSAVLQGFNLSFLHAGRTTCAPIPPHLLVARCSYSGSTLTKLIATFLSGILIGLTATALQALVDLVCTHRNRLLDALRRGGGVPLHGALAALQGLPLVFGAMLAISLSAVLASTLAVHCWAPRASGGGVALVMALLNGNAIAGLLSVKVYVAKLLGTAASRLAGLALGVEGEPLAACVPPGRDAGTAGWHCGAGPASALPCCWWPAGPMIHLGSAVASLVCHGEHGEPCAAICAYPWPVLPPPGRSPCPLRHTGAPLLPP